MAAATKTKTLEITSPNIGRIDVRIRGKTPLLQNRWRPSAIAQMEAKQQKQAKNKKDARDPEAEFKEILEAATISNNGKRILGHPKVAFVEAMAAAGYRLGDWNSMVELKGAINVDLPGELVPIEGPDPEMDTRPVNLGRTWSVAYRPKYWPWEMVVPIEFDRGVVTEEQVVRLLQDAGRGVGLGSYRPENGGPMGRFEVVEAKVYENGAG